MRSLIIAAGLSFTLLSGCHLENQSQYSQDLYREREKKDFAYKHSTTESPFQTKDERVMFVGLKYFEPNVDYRVPAKIELLQAQKQVIPDSRDVDKEYYKVGVVYFTLQGKPLKLTAYQTLEQFAEQKPDSPKVMFVPFKDETTGKETFEGGRVLDIRFTGKDSIVLDLNYAYNPFCAYRTNFGCVVPPTENILPIRIEAGERKFFE